MYSNIQPFKSVLYFCSLGGWTKKSWLGMLSIQINSQRMSSASSGLDMSSSVQGISYMTYQVMGSWTYRSTHSTIQWYHYRYIPLFCMFNNITTRRQQNYMHVGWEGIGHSMTGEGTSQKKRGISVIRIRGEGIWILPYCFFQSEMQAKVLNN